VEVESYSYDGFGNMTGKTIDQGDAGESAGEFHYNRARIINDYGFDANGTGWACLGL